MPRLSFPRHAMRVISIAAGIAAVIHAQPQPGAEKKGERKGPPRDMSKIVPPLEETGFVSMFDGKTLKGWEGDPDFFRVSSFLLFLFDF